MKKIIIIKVLLTSVAIIISIIHICYPQLKIDSITLGLFIVAVLPWLAPIFKSVELPGGMKFELQDFKEIEEKADKAGMIERSPNKNGKEYSFLLVAKEDPKLALAGLRIELEDKLRKLALKNDIDMSYKGLRQIMEVLSDHDLITFDERSVLSDMAGMLNSAVHSEGEALNYSSVSWALDVGTRILDGLEKRLNS